ncbi:DUF6318 family protein [Actinomyces radicidentis]|uniref:DUF6318 family protein n=1 Tax=Actinomyces radicidentis TaxID=111015 RepID=UPI001F3EEC88|nr:DUF6318 family protein [Actinomyces radicidentis]
MDPYDVAASVQASQSATASVSLSPEDAALREAALAMQAPEKPARMGENSPEGAVAAAEYFVSLYPYVYATGDLTEWDAMSEDGCVFCGSVHDNVTELHESGGWTDPWVLDVNSREYAPPTAGHEYTAVRLSITQPTTTTHSGKSSPKVGQSEETVLTLAMRYDGNTWFVGEGETE